MPLRRRRRQHGRLQLAHVADGLDEDEVGRRGFRDGIRRETDLFGEGRVGVVEGKVSGGREEPTRRADVQRDLLRARRAGVRDRRADELAQVVTTLVLQAVRAKRVREDDVRTSLDIGAVDGRDGRRILEVPVHRVLAGGKSRRLDHGAKAAIKKYHC